MTTAELVDHVDVASYMSSYIDLQPKGSELWGLSPFKSEKTPSFSVNPSTGMWYDFSAGLGGNLVDFVMKYKHVGLRQAFEELASFAGVDDTLSPSSRPMSLDATRVAKKYRHSQKPQKAASSAFLPDDVMLRYEPNAQKLQPWVDEGIAPEVLMRFQVRYDPFDDRIVFPIRDYEGHIISVSGRTCDPDFKQKGIRKYTYFQKIGTLDTLYGFWENKSSILSARKIILFEGAKSVMKAYSYGVEYTAALLTSHLSDGQLRFLIRLCSFHGVSVIFSLDKDVDISLDKSMDKNIRVLRRYASVSYIKDDGDLLEAKDSPVDQGREVFLKLLNGARTL